MTLLFVLNANYRDVTVQTKLYFTVLPFCMFLLVILYRLVSWK